MKHEVKRGGSALPPAKQLAGFLAKYDAAISGLARAVRVKLRRQMPTAIEFVYDNYNALVIGFGPNERASDAIVSLVLYPRRVNLCFLWGAKLADPQKLLRGSGNQVRNIILEQAADLDRPAVQALLAEAIRTARAPFPLKGRGQTLIRAIAAKQRPRRPPPEESKPKPLAKRPLRTAPKGGR